MKISIIVSQFNSEITSLLLEGAVTRLQELGMVQSNIDIIRVPGAIELPLAAQQAARRGQCQAIICLGAVIRGETDHYQYVCQQVSYGCQHVALQHNIPVIFGVLTTDTEQQALARCTKPESHKGRESADAAIQMISIMKLES